jgi:hypothetical protein
VCGLSLTIEECGVVPTGQPGDLTARGPSRSADRRLGRRDAVLVVGHNEEGATDLRGESAGPVEANTDRRPRGNVLLPLRIAISGVERRSAVAGVGCGQGCNRASLAGQRYQQRIAPNQAGHGVGGSTTGEASQCARGGVPERGDFVKEVTARDAKSSLREGKVWGRSRTRIIATAG